MLMTACLCLCFTGGAFFQSNAQQPKTDRAAALQTIREQVHETFLKSTAEILKASDDDKKKLREKVYSETLPAFITKAMDLIQQNPSDDTAFDALVWVMEQQGCWNTVEANQHARILEQIEAYHFDRPDLMKAIYWLPWLQLDLDDIKSGELKTRFVAKALKESKHDAVRATACYTLAKWAFFDYEQAIKATKLDLKTISEAAAKAEKYFIILERDFSKVMNDPAEGRNDLNDLTRKIMALKTGQPQPEPKPLKPRSYGAIAEGYLVELRSLAIGKEPPRLAGIGLDGKPLNLADYRGKVVVVVFWAKWCAFCMANVPAEIELVNRMKGKPFALLGVNGDEVIELAKKSAESSKINWPSIWQNEKGMDENAILKAWNIRRWPTLYVIDHHGIIRAKDVHGKDLDQIVDELIKEMEREKKNQ